MGKAKLTLIAIAVIITVSASSFYAYLYGFSEARELTILNTMLITNIELSTCIEAQSIDCVNEANQHLQRLRYYMARDLLKQAVGLTEESTKE